MEAIKEIGINKSIRYLLFSLWQYLFFLMFVSPLRILLLRLSGAKIGKDTVIERIKFTNLYSRGLSGLSVGKRCFLGDGAVLDMADKINIKDNVTISVEAFILTHTNVGYKNHPLQKSIRRLKKEVVLKRGSFVGARAIIMPGVVIEEKSVVGAASLVNKSVERNTVVAGVPAKRIKRIK